MTTAVANVSVKIDRITKERAAKTLGELGLSFSDAIRMFVQRIADEDRLPFEGKVPNAETREAINEIEAGNGKGFDNVDDLFADLHAVN